MLRFPGERSRRRVPRGRRVPPAQCPAGQIEHSGLRNRGCSKRFPNSSGAKKSLRNEVQWQFIQQAIETGPGEASRCGFAATLPHQTGHPFQPGRIVYSRSHPFSVKRLSAKARDGHFTGVISCIVSTEKTRSGSARGRSSGSCPRCLAPSSRSRVVKAQLSAFEWTRLAMEEIDERQIPRGDGIAARRRYG